MDGTDSTAGLALAPHELLRAFSAKTLARGETYANQGRVATARYEPLDGTLAGTCLGSKGEYYEVEVALSGPRTNLEIEYAVCTCPVGRYCKHAVAMLMAAFAVLFGTRHIDATEHQDGLMLAIAVAFGALSEETIATFVGRGVAKLVERNEFREDLYYRLAEIVVTIPPLRQRLYSNKRLLS